MPDSIFAGSNSVRIKPDSGLSIKSIKEHFSVRITDKIIYADLTKEGIV